MATQFSELGIKAEAKGLLGDKLKIERLFGKKIRVEAFRIKPSNFEGNRLELQFVMNGNRHVVFTGSLKLQELIQKVPTDKFPFDTIIIKQEDGSFQFT